MKSHKYQQAYELRTQGYSYKKIGEMLHISTSVAYQFSQMPILLQSSGQQWTKGLPRRLAVPLHQAGFKSKEEFLQVWENDRETIYRCRGIGPVGIARIEVWLGT